MPRVVYKKFYDHDDRAGGSGNIRKVSFMNGTGGRVKKNRRPDQFVTHFGDEDVEMGGSDRKMWKGKKGQRKNFKGRSGSPTFRNNPKQPIPPLRISDWYQVRILYGAKYEKATIHRLLLKHTAPSVFYPCFGYTAGNDLLFYVNDFEAAKLLRNANKKILLEDGHLMFVKVRESTPPSPPVDEELKKKIKLVMAKRYMADTKALDLSNFAADPDIHGEVYCPLGRPPIMKAIWQIINENISDLVALNLSNNKITVFDDSMSVEIKKLSNLRVLHLGDNNIKSLQSLSCFNGSELTELELRKNPITKLFKDNTHYVRYESGVTEIRNKFPKLTKLDGMELPPVIAFDVISDEEAKLPSPQAAFMCNQEGRGIVKEFLSQYFAIYDSDNRLDLAQAYHDMSSFSICAYYPPNQKSNIYRLNNYMQDSRNLFRITDYPRRKSRLRLGKQNIVQFLSQLPKSQHDLSSFVVDLSLFTPVLINLTVSGVFREPNSSTSPKSWPVRHFSRIFLIVPVGQGFCITNDMLLVTNATTNEIQCSFVEGTQDATLLQSPSAPSTSAKMPAADDSVRIQMVQTLATRTGMNLAWSEKCLNETQWDFDRALWAFNELQSKGSIPPEAFVK